jgi:hypothetical protein
MIWRTMLRSAVLALVVLAGCGGGGPSGPLTCTEKPSGGTAQPVACHAAICQCSVIASTSFTDRCADLCKKTQPFHCEQFPQMTVWTIENLRCAACAGVDGGASCP